MVNPQKRQFAEDPCMDDADQNSDVEETVDVSLSGVETPESANPSISRRLTEIFLEDGDEDLLLQRSDKEDGVLQWLRTLDMQVMGACRADERLKPLLKLNVSSGEVEDRLLAHLSQYFEPSEVGLLARCLCVPLVSIRVGKINKQGTLLSPTSLRGNLCLTLLPSSDLRLSFNGDDGSVERLATVTSEAKCNPIVVEEISADKSGRSFFIKATDSMVFYFWCSEKSQLLGNELLRKMKDLLMRKPSLAELTGISEGRLNAFATHVRAYLGGSTVISAHSSDVLSASTPSNDDSVDSSEPHLTRSSFTNESIHSQQYSSQGSTTNLNYKGSLSPRSSSFTDGLPKSFSVEVAASEKLMAGGVQYALPIDNFSLDSTNRTCPYNSSCFEKDKLPEASGINPFATLDFVAAFGKPAELPHSGPKVQVPSSFVSHFSPHYCWCPPVASKLEYTLGNSQLTTLSTESLYLPPLSSLISAARHSSLLTSKSSLNLAQVPAADFPSFLPEPLITSHQIPTFTPLICDPIVHIPVIDVCSSGPGYLVSAGPAIATTIPPLSPNLVDPLLSNAESVVEKSARETLRMLISGTNQQLLDVLPSVSSGSDDEQNAVIATTGNRGLYRDVDAISSNLTTLGPVSSSSKKSMGVGVGKLRAGRDDLIDKKEKPSSSGIDAE